MVFLLQNAQLLCQPCRIRFNLRINARIFIQHGQLGKACCHGNRITGQGSCLIHRAGGRYLLHQLPGTGKRAYRHTAANDLAKGDQVSTHAEIFLCAAPCQTEAGDDLVKNQQRTVLVTQVAQPLQKALCRRNNAHIGSNRLHNHRCHLIFVGGKQLLHAVQIIVSRCQRVLRNGCGYTGGIRSALCQRTGASLDQHGIGMSVIAALKLDDFIPSGGATCQTHRTHDGLGAGIDHAYHLNMGYHGNHQLCQPGFQSGGRTEAQTMLHNLCHSVQYLRVGMSQNHRAPGAHIINIFHTVHISDIRTLCAADKPRCHAYGTISPNRTVHAARHDFTCLFKHLFRSIHHPISPFFMACASSLA